MTPEEKKWVEEHKDLYVRYVNRSVIDRFISIIEKQERMIDFLKSNISEVRVWREYRDKFLGDLK